MVGFLISGILLTLLILAGGAVAWWWLGRSSVAESAKRRHREEARQLQTQLDQDPDFARNFHRPTQNEVLETLQALDHLTPGWELDNETLTDVRLKNELAESFPALRRTECIYPFPIAGDLERLFDRAELSPEAWESSLQAHAEKQARSRAAFHAARARANAKHQMAVGPKVAPVALPPGSLPFRVSEERPARRQPKWVARAAYTAVAGGAVAGASWYVATHPGFRREFQFSEATATANHAADASTPNPDTTAPTPVPVMETSPILPAATPVSVEAMRAQAIASAQGTAPAEAAPTPTPPSADTPPPLAPAPANTAAQASLAQQIVASKLRAIDKHPTLAIPNSEVNLRFVFRYKKLVEEKSPRLQEPDWPEKLADECAGAAGTGNKPKKPTQTAPAHR